MSDNIFDKLRETKVQQPVVEGLPEGLKISKRGADDKVPLNSFDFIRSTELTGIGSSKYDEGLLPDENYIDKRAENQPGMAKLGSGLVNTAVQLPLEALKNASYLLDFPQYKNLIDGSEKEFGNWFGDIMQKTEDNLKAPVYRSQATSSGFQPQTAGWWADNMPSMATTLSMVIPSSLAVKGLGGAAKIIGGDRILSELGWGVHEVNTLRGVTGAVVSRHMENIAEGAQTFQSTYDEALKAGKSDPDAKQIAGEAARQNYNLNWAALAQDIPEYLIMFGAFKNAKKFSTLGKEAPSNFMTGLKDAGKVALLEGSEEQYQFITDKEAQRNTLIKAGIRPNDKSTLGDRLLSYAKDGDLWTAGVFGALGGTVASAFSSVKNRINDRKKDELYNTLLDMHKAVLLNDPESFLKTQDNTFLSAALAHFQAGTLDNFKRDVEKLRTADKQDLSNTIFESKEYKEKLDQRLEDIDYLENIGHSINNRRDLTPEVKGFAIANTLTQKLIERRLGTINNEINSIATEDIAKNGVSPTLMNLKRRILERSALTAVNNPDTKSRRSDLTTKISNEIKNIKEDNDNFPNLKTIEDITKAIATSSDNNPETDLKSKYLHKAINEDDLDMVKSNLEKINTKDGAEELQKQIEKKKKKDAEANKEADINHIVNKIKAGEKIESPEDLQLYENNKKEIEKRLAEEKTDEDKPAIIEKTEGGQKYNLISEDGERGNRTFYVEDPKSGEPIPLSEKDGYLKKGEAQQAIRGTREELESPDIFSHMFKHRAGKQDYGDSPASIQEILSHPDYKDRIKLEVHKSYSATNTGEAFNDNALQGKKIWVQERLPDDIDVTVSWKTDKEWIPIFDVHNPAKFIYANKQVIDFNKITPAEFFKDFYFGKDGVENKGQQNLQNFEIFRANYNRLREFHKQLQIWYADQKIDSPTKRVEVPRDSYDITLIAPLSVAKVEERPSITDVPSMNINGQIVVFDNRTGKFISGKEEGIKQNNSGNEPTANFFLEDGSRADYNGKLALSVLPNGLTTWVKIVAKHYEKADIEALEGALKEVTTKLQEWGIVKKDKVDYRNLLDKLNTFIAYKKGYNIEFSIVEPAQTRNGLIPAALTLQVNKDDKTKEGTAVVYFPKGVRDLNDLIHQFNTSYFNKEKIELNLNSFRRDHPEDNFDPSKYESVLNKEIRKDLNIKFTFYPENLITTKEKKKGEETESASPFLGVNQWTKEDLESMQEWTLPEGKSIEKAKEEQKEEEKKPKEDDDFSVYKSGGEYGKLNVGDAIKYIKKTLPSFITIEDIGELVNKLHLYHIPFGGFSHNIIYLNNNSKQGVVYHEIMHAILRTLMNDTQIRTILREVEKLTGRVSEGQIQKFKNIDWRYEDLTNEQIKDLVLEDRLADMFEKWKENKEAGKQKGLIQKFFDKIVSFYKWITGKRTNLERLFNKIDSGGFRNATIVDSNFSKIGSESVYKMLPGKGNWESRAIVASFSAKMKREGYVEQNGKIIQGSYKITVNDLIANELKYYDINSVENQRILNTLTPELRAEMIEEYNNEIKFYENPETQQILRLEVDKFMATLDKDYLSEEDVDEEEKETRMRSFDKDITSEGGYDTLSKEMRAYFNTTLHTVKDKFGKDKEVAIDGSMVYASTEQLLVGVKENEVIPRLLASAKYKPQTRALVERLIVDTGWNTEGNKVSDKQEQALKRFYKAFDKERIKWLHIQHEGSKVRVFNAQQNEIEDYIFSKWFNAFKEDIDRVQFKEDINAFKRKINGLNQPKWRFNDIPVTESLVRILNDIGIDVSEALVDLSFNEESTLKALFNDEEKITEEQLTLLSEKITLGINPFIGQVDQEDEGMKGTLKNWARTDKNFREDYFVPSFLDAEGKRRYTVIMPNYAIRKGRELKEELSREENVKVRQANPYFQFNTLLQGKPETIAENFKNNDISILGDIRKDERVGVSYKDLDPKSFKSLINNVFLVTEEGGNSDYATYVLGINETKKTLLGAKLPLDKTLYSTEGIGDVFLDKVFNTIFKQEVLRVQGKFGKFANNNFIYLPFLNEEKYKDLNTTDFESVKKEIKEAIKQYFESEIEKLKLINKDIEHLLDRKGIEAYASYDNYIGNFVLNYFLNVTGYNQLSIGDGAQFENLIDMVKRASGYVAFHSSQEGRVINYAYTSDYEYSVDPRIDPKETKGKLDDGQVLATIEHQREFLRSQGRLTGVRNAILNKIENPPVINGKLWTPSLNELKEIDLISLKDVTYGQNTEGVLTNHKNSTFVLTKQLTSFRINDKGKWYPKPGLEHLHNKREFMEKHNIHQFVPPSVVKINKKNIQVIDNKVFDSNEHESLNPGEHFKIYSIDGKYQGEQLINQTKKEKPIITGVQLINLIDTELNDENKKLGTELQNTLSEIHKIAAQQALNQLVNENFEKGNIRIFLEKIREGIENSTPDVTLDYLFQDLNGDMVGDPNLPQIMKKFEQYYLAHFRPALVTRSMGDKKTIVGIPYKVIEDQSKGTVVTHDEYIDRVNKAGNEDEFKKDGKLKENFELRRLGVKFKDDGTIDYVEVITTRRTASLLGATINKIQDIDEKLLQGLGIRIPTQSHHSMIKYKIVEFMPEFYGSSIVAAPEIYYLSGADNDIDSLFTYKYDSYKDTNGRIVLYGSAVTDKQKWYEYKNFQLERNQDVKKEYEKLAKVKYNSEEGFVNDLLNTDDPILVNAMKNLGLPSSADKFKAKGSPTNIGVLNNRMLDSMLKILSLPDVQESLKTPANDNKLDRAANYIFENLKGLSKSSDNFSTVSGLYNMWVNVNTGTNNIGPVVNASLANAVLTKYKVDLNEKYYLSFNGKSYKTFAADKETTRQKADDLSTLVTAMTDNPKKPLAFYANLPLELVGHEAVMNSLGIPIENTGILFMNQPIMDEIGKSLKNIKSAVDPGKESKYKILESLKSKYKLPKSLDITDDEMIKSIELSKKETLTDEEKQELYYIQAKVFHTFLKIDAIAQNFIQVNQVLSLSKGFGSDFSSIDKIKEAVRRLGLDKENPIPEYQKNSLTFDFNTVLQQNANIRTNIQILKNTERAAKNFSIQQTDFFKEIYTSLQPSLKQGMTATDVGIVKSDLQTYLAMQAFITQLKIDVPKYNNLFKKGTSLGEEFKSLMKHDEFRKNPLVSFLKFIPTTYFSKGQWRNNPENKTGLELLVADNRVKLSVNTVEKYIDSYTQLLKSENKDISDFAKKMIAYLLAKDNLNFKGDSFVKIISPDRFAQKGNPNSHSNILKKLNKELAKDKPDDKVIKELIGKTMSELKKEFTEIFSRHTKNNRAKYSLIKRIYTANAPFSVKGEDGKSTILYSVTKKDNTLNISLAVDHSNQMKDNNTFDYKVDDKGFISKVLYPDFFHLDYSFYRKVSSNDTGASYIVATTFGNRFQMPYHMDVKSLDNTKTEDTDNTFAGAGQYGEIADFNPDTDSMEDYEPLEGQGLMDLPIPERTEGTQTFLPFTSEDLDPITAAFGEAFPTKSSPKEEADKNPKIEQNFFNGYRPNSDTSKIHTFRPEFIEKYGLRASTMDLIKGGDRTRTTRSKSWMEKEGKNLKVGDYVWQVDKKGNKILTQITAITPNTKDTWYKEGWIDSNFEYVKSYPTAIEFQLVKDESSKKNLLFLKDNQVNYKLKILNSLNQEKSTSLFNRFWNKDRTKFWKELNNQVPQQQIDFLNSVIQDKDIKSIDGLKIAVLAEMSYVVEINTSKQLKGSPNQDTRTRFAEVGIDIDQEFESEIDREERYNGKRREYTPTQHYSDLTVPGGTNYTENEISIPNITPSIKGHAQFSTDNGIGWVRTDETIDKRNLRTYWNPETNREETFADLDKNEEIHNTKTRRILEIQSDLFQKGRDKDNLNQDTPLEARKNVEKNQFLQLLNKDNNWVTFFVKSLIQDSAKKGYEKVLFPTGNTASKVEGHSTLEEFKKEKEARLADLESLVKRWEELKDNNAQSAIEALDKNIDKSNIEIKQIKEELQRVETQGFAALAPIFKFYEENIKNILKKNYQVQDYTDEYGNTWNQITLDKTHLNDILLLKGSNEFGADQVAHEIYSKLKENNSNAKDVLEAFTKSNNTVLASFSKKLLEKLHNNVNIEVLSEVAFNNYIILNGINENMEDASALFNPDTNDIVIRKDIMRDNLLSYALLHEIIHSQTYDEIHSNSQAAKQWNALYDYVLTQLTEEEKKEYPFSNSDELIAGLLKNETIKILSSKPAIQGRKYKNLFEEIYETIKSWIKTRFGLDSKELTLYDQVFAAATQVFHSAHENQERDFIHTDKELQFLKANTNESPYKQQQIFLKKRISTIEKRLNNATPGTPAYIDLKNELDDLKVRIEDAITKQDKTSFEALGREVLDGASNFIKELEDGTIQSSDKKIEYASEVIEAWKEFKGLETEVGKLEDRLFPFIENFMLGQVKEYLGDKITLSDINDQKMDIATLTKGWGSLSDVVNYIASTIGIIIKRAQNRASTKSKEQRDKVQEEVDKLFKWAKKNGISHSKVYDIFIQDNKGTTILAQSHIVDGTNVIVNPNYDKIQNTPELKTFYDFYKATIQENTKDLPVTLPAYFIPNIKANGIKNTLKDINPVKVRKIGDNSYNEEYSSDIVPLKYFKPMISSEKSKDLGNSLLSFIRHANEFKELSEVLPTVRLLQRSLTRKRNAEGNIIDRMFIPKSNPNAEISGRDSKLWKMVDKVINMQVKGNMKADEGKRKVRDYVDEKGNQVESYFDIPDAVDNLLHWNSMLRIGFSPITAASNVIFGDISNVIEAIGGRFFGLRDLHHASLIFTRQTLKKDSIVNKLLEFLNPLQELDDYVNIESGLKGRMTKEKLQEYMYSMQKGGEKYLQSRTLLAVMLKKGYLTTKGELTKTGEFLLKESKNLTAKEIKEREELVDLTQRLNQMIHGRYSQREAATWSQNLWYRVAAQFKKWIPAAYEARFGEKQMDNRLKVEIEGRYITFAKLIFTKDILKNISKLSKGKLSEMEMYNMRKNLAEITLALATVAAYFLLHGGDDDDKKRRRKNPFIKTTLTLLNRASGDINLWYNPAEFEQLIGNPAPVLKLVKDLTSIPWLLFTGIGYQMAGKPKWRYKTGSRKDQIKVLSKLGNVTPGAKSFMDALRMGNHQQLEELKPIF